MKAIPALAICGVVLSGCATVTQGTTQTIAISTSPAYGATCALTDREGSWSVVTPGSARVQKSKEDIAIHCSKAGWQDASAIIPSSFAGATIGNVFIGGLVGVAIDASTGASNQYPQAFVVAMTPLPGTRVDPPPPPPPLPPISDAVPRIDASGVNLQPSYPDTAMDRKEAGSVAVHVYVRDDGTVKKVSIAQSSGFDDLDNAAANAVLHWKFLPAMASGKPVSGDAVVQITFQPPSGR